MTPRARMLVLGAILPACWLAATVVPFVISWGRLPDPLATHWSLAGTPNGAMPRVFALLLHVGFACGTAAGAWSAVQRGNARLLGTCVFTGVLFGGLAIGIVRANLDVSTWEDAAAVTLVTVLAISGVAAGAAALAGLAARPLAPVPSRHDAARLPSVGLGATERAMWTGHARNRVLVVLALVLIAAAIGASRVATAWSAIGYGVGALAVIAFAEVQVTIGERGVVVALGMGRFPRIRLPLERIRAARAIDVAPLARGGWGYRGSLRVLGRAAVIVRRGEGLELTVDGDRTFIVTVDDATTAAGLVNDLIARRGR